jgi:nucleoside-diphosphate-sugar epimerase
VWAEFGPMLEKLFARRIDVTYSNWRTGDQKVCVYDISRAESELGWKQKFGLETGIEDLYHWVVENKELFD